MTTLHEAAMRQALDALLLLKRAFFKNASTPEEIAQGCDHGFDDYEAEWVVPSLQAIEALRSALAQQGDQQRAIGGPGEVLGAPHPDWPEWCETFSERKAYQQGVADARAIAAPAAQQGEQQLVAYVPVDSKLRDANWNHPNDTEKCDQQCQEALDARGDNKGQGLDGYWKWGFKAGWNAALAQQGEQQPLTTQQRDDLWNALPVQDTNQDYYIMGILDAERHHGIAGAAPAAQPLEKRND